MAGGGADAGVHKARGAVTDSKGQARASGLLEPPCPCTPLTPPDRRASLPALPPLPLPLLLSPLLLPVLLLLLLRWLLGTG